VAGAIERERNPALYQDDRGSDDPKALVGKRVERSPLSSAGATSMAVCVTYSGDGVRGANLNDRPHPKLSERTNRARIINICPLHNIVGV